MRTEEELGGKVTDGSHVLLEQSIKGSDEPLQQTITHTVGNCHVEIIAGGRSWMAALNVKQVISERLLERFHARASADVLDFFLPTRFSRWLHALLPLIIFAKVPELGVQVHHDTGSVFPLYGSDWFRWVHRSSPANVVKYFRSLFLYLIFTYVPTVYSESLREAALGFVSSTSCGKI